jgi:hypothetical protein
MIRFLLHPLTAEVVTLVCIFVVHDNTIDMRHNSEPTTYPEKSSKNRVKMAICIPYLSDAPRCDAFLIPHIHYTP